MLPSPANSTGVVDVLLVLGVVLLVATVDVKVSVDLVVFCSDIVVATTYLFIK